MKVKKSNDDSSSLRKEARPVPALDPAERSCRNCCLWVTSLILSPLGLCFFVIGYCVMGAFLFRAVEAPHEMGKWSRVAALEKATINELWALNEQIKDGLMGMNRSEFEGNVRRLVRNMVLAAQEPELRGRIQLIDTGVEALAGEEDDRRYTMQWTFTGALLYSVSLITTVGYCHVMPVTTSGQLLTILYALIGIPLFIGYLVKVGRCLADGFRAFYRVVCCDLLCCRKCERKKRRRAYSFATDDVQSVNLNGGERLSVRRRKDQTTTTTTMVTSHPVDEHARDLLESGFADVELMKPDRSGVKAARGGLTNDDYDLGLGKWNNSSKRHSSGSKSLRRDVQQPADDAECLSALNPKANRRQGMNHVYERIPYGNRAAAKLQQQQQQEQQLPVARPTLSLLDEGTKYDHSGRRIAPGTMSLQHKPKTFQRQPSSTTTDTRSRQGKYYDDIKATTSLDRKQIRGQSGHVSRSPIYTPPGVSSGGTNVQSVNSRLASPAGDPQVSKDKRQSLQQSHRDVLAAALKLEEARKARLEKPEEFALSGQGLKFINRRSNPIVASDYGASIVTQPTRAAARIQRSISADTKPTQSLYMPTEAFKSKAESHKSNVEKGLKHHAAHVTKKSELQQFCYGREKKSMRPASPMLQKVRAKLKNKNKCDEAPEDVRRSNDSFVTAPSEDSSHREPSTSVDGSSDEDIARSTRPRKSRKKSKQLPAATKTKEKTNDDVFATSSQNRRRCFGRTTRKNNKPDESIKTGNRVVAAAAPTPLTSAVSPAMQRDYILLEQTFYSPDDSSAAAKQRDGGAPGEDVTKQQRKQHRVSVPISMTLAVLIVYVAVGTLLFSVWENVSYLVGSYFCFMTLTTIGIGGDVTNNGNADVSDYYARADEKRVACSVWLACGLSVVAMCVSLAHDRLVDRCHDGDHPPALEAEAEEDARPSELA